MGGGTPFPVCFRVPCLPPAARYARIALPMFAAVEVQGPEQQRPQWQHPFEALTALPRLALLQFTARPSAEPDAAALQSASDWTMPVQAKGRSRCAEFLQCALLQCWPCSALGPQTPSFVSFLLQKPLFQWLHRWSAQGCPLSGSDLAVRGSSALIRPDGSFWPQCSVRWGQGPWVLQALLPTFGCPGLQGLISPRLSPGLAWAFCSSATVSIHLCAVRGLGLMVLPTPPPRLPAPPQHATVSPSAAGTCKGWASLASVCRDLLPALPPTIAHLYALLR